MTNETSERVASAAEKTMRGLEALEASMPMALRSVGNVMNALLDLQMVIPNLKAIAASALTQREDGHE